MLLLIPMTKKTNRYAIKQIGSLLDVGFGRTRCLTKEFCDKYVDHPIYMEKNDIDKIELYTDLLSGKIVLIETKDFYMLLGTPKVGYSMDITTSFYSLTIFM